VIQDLKVHQDSLVDEVTLGLLGQRGLLDNLDQEGNLDHLDREVQQDQVVLLALLVPLELGVKVVIVETKV
jgi:hypothetical protein